VIVVRLSISLLWRENGDWWQTLADYFIWDGWTLQLIPFNDEVVHVLTPTGEAITLDVDLGDTIKQIKAKINEKGLLKLHRWNIKVCSPLISSISSSLNEQSFGASWF
jgi:hypothetical protein